MVVIYIIVSYVAMRILLTIATNLINPLTDDKLTPIPKNVQNLLIFAYFVILFVFSVFILVILNNSGYSSRYLIMVIAITLLIEFKVGKSALRQLRAYYVLNGGDIFNKLLSPNSILHDSSIVTDEILEKTYDTRYEYIIKLGYVWTAIFVIGILLIIIIEYLL